METEQLLHHLRRRLQTLAAAAAVSDHDGHLSISLDIPAPSGPADIAGCEDCLYWARPADGRLRLAAGRIVVAEAAGPRRFAVLDDALQRFGRGWRRLAPDGHGVDDALFCGFAFGEQPHRVQQTGGLANSLLFLPEALLVRHHGEARLVFSCRGGQALEPVLENWLYRARQLLAPAGSGVGRGVSAPAPLLPVAGDPGDWTPRVERALAAIAGGRFDKLVISRRLRVDLPAGFRLQRMLDWLQPRYPRCTQFAVRNGGYTLVGVSPERLASLRGRRLQVDAIGGSCARGAGAADDRRLAARLLRDAKSLREHRLVVEQITALLQPLCRSLVRPDRPGLLRLPTVQHLHSLISGQLRHELSLLRLASVLHPTPAVGGQPRRTALDWLLANGEQDRGWYSGALGWLDPHGGGELAVILRCGLLGQQQAELYAGAGIVAGSEPQQEFVETGWKLHTMIEALQAGAARPDPRRSRRPGTG